MQLAPTPRRSSSARAQRVRAGELVRLPRRLVQPAPILATLGLLVLVSVPTLGEGGWVFRPGPVEPQGALAPLVRAAGNQWDPALLRAAALLAGVILVLAAAQTRRSTWSARQGVALVAVVITLLLLPGVLLQVGLRDATAPWFFTNDATYEIELAGDLVLAGDSPYGHDYRDSGLERFYSLDGTPSPNHAALDHFAYFPGAALSSAGWRLLPAPLDDYRLLVLLATIAMALAVLAFAGPLTVRLAIGAVLAANPLALQAAWFGTADAPSLLFLVLAFALASRSRFVWAAASLATAVLLKQFALVAIPFFAAMLLTSRGGRQSFGRAAAAFAAVVVAGFLPFLLANPAAVWNDTVAYGTGEYPIIGYGLAPLLVRAGILHGNDAAYPFGLLAIAVWLPVTLWLLRNQLRARLPWVGAAGFAGSIFLLLFLGRVFQPSHLIWPLTGMALAAVLASAQAARGISTTNVEPELDSDLTEMRPFIRSTSSLQM